MWCGICNMRVAECICPDINERLAKVAAGGRFAYKRCKKCREHYERCKCSEPEWENVGAEFHPLGFPT